MLRMVMHNPRSGYYGAITNGGSRKDYPTMQLRVNTIEIT